MSRPLSIAIYLLVVLVLVLVLGARASRAEAPRGEARPVEHVLVFEGLDTVAANLDLWLVPAQGELGGTARRLESDRSFRFVTDAALRVAASPRGRTLDDREPLEIVSRRLLRPDLTTHDRSSVTRRETRVRIFGVTDGVVHLRVVGYREFDDEGRQVNGRFRATLLGERDLLGLGIAGVLLSLGIAVARRRPERLA